MKRVAHLLRQTTPGLLTQQVIDIMYSVIPRRPAGLVPWIPHFSHNIARRAFSHQSGNLARAIELRALQSHLAASRIDLRISDNRPTPFLPRQHLYHKTRSNSTRFAAAHGSRTCPTHRCRALVHETPREIHLPLRGRLCCKIHSHYLPSRTLCEAQCPSSRFI
jgi:hypothetical protein